MPTTTLTAIGVTLLGGSAVLLLCILAFQYVLWNQSPKIAPRCTARPPETISNRWAEKNAPLHDQHRCGGNWVKWVMSLSEATLLHGVPGTGTRKGGLEGKLLHVTLDCIVLIRFHRMGRKVAALATALCILVLMPLYITTPQPKHLVPAMLEVPSFSHATAIQEMNATNNHHNNNDNSNDYNDSNNDNNKNDNNNDKNDNNLNNNLIDCTKDFSSNELKCNNSTWILEKEQHRLQEEQQRNYYRRTTLGNVPNLYYFRHEQSQHRFHQEQISKTIANSTDWSETVPDDAIVFRLRAAVLVVWLVTLYCYHLLTEEWKELVALRRIWYLEQRKWVRDVTIAALPTPQTPRPTSSSSSLQFGEQHQGTNGSGDRTNANTTGVATRKLERLVSSNVSAIRNESDWYRGFAKHDNDDYYDDDDDDNEEYYLDEDYHNEEVTNNNNNNNNKSLVAAAADDDDDHVQLKDREAWIPHPEQPDTVPNIEPYSILIGPLPKVSRVLDISPSALKRAGIRPLHHDEEGSFLANSELPFPQQLLLQSIVHQLEGQVPKEPGYSSPICAISVLPTAKEIGPVWMRWYDTLKKLRRLLFIQKYMRNLGYDLDDDDDEEVPMDNQQEAQGSAIMTEMSSSSSSRTRVNRGKNHYMREVFGQYLLDEEWIAEAEARLGPEQLGVYSRELAQAAAPCCPYGCLEGQIRGASLSRLKHLHKQQKLIVEDAKEELKKIQKDFMFRPTLFEENEYENEDDSEDHSESELDDMEGLSLLRPSTESPNGHTNSWKNGRGFIARKRSFASRCLSRARRLHTEEDAGDDDEHDNGAVEMVTSGQSSNRPTSPTTRRQKRPKDLWTTIQWILSRVTRRQISQLISFHAMELARQYRSPDAWRRLMVKCWGGWDHEDPYVVVTFTSRRAAAAARQSLSSSGVELNDIPVPPLADAGALRLLPFRFFCRPVTVTVNAIQKGVRFYMILAFLVLMCIFYTIPLTRAANRLDPDTIAYLFPKHERIKSSTGVSLPDLLSGLTTSIIWSLFFMLCPQVFKLVAYSGSNATSLAQAERCAHQYFWWFMLFTAFAGPMLAYWILGALYYRDDTLQGGLRKMLLAIAGTTPTTIAATWINWIIYRFTIILPINFLLQFNAFMFAFLGCNCCSRLTIGGGPGGPTPYRLFVDSGVVLMCCVALSPASPIVAPASLLYFLLLEPLLRRNSIFVYRQRYDDGGMRWIFVFDMIISLLIVGQLLLALQMVLKTAYGCSFAAASAIPTTLYFRWNAKRRYKPSFVNTALLQTNLLDGKESLDDLTIERREEHRRYLVDAHRAAYIPACLCGTECEAVLTASPAVVIKDRIIDSRGSEDRIALEEIKGSMAPSLIEREANNSPTGGFPVPRKRGSGESVSNRLQRKHR